MATAPHTHPDLYKSIYIGGVLSPGKVTLSGFDRDHDWDVQKAKGSTGATTVNRGPANGGFVASFYLADLEDLSAWDDFQTMLAASVEGAKPKALAAYHPDLVRNKILDVVVKSIGGFTHDGKGGATVVCKFIEYRPPKAKPAVKAGAAAKAQPKAPDPNAAAKAELSALLAQAKEP